MYSLSITESDVKALEFVSGRYDCGTCLLLHLLDSENIEYLDPNSEDPDYCYGFNCEMTESQAWEVREMIDQDTEYRETSHPLLGGSLWAKLTDLYDSIV
jgi:hypothetical protein